eukprot:TRINITY_DN17558_c1_g1_i1.p1 TRINITY_DN17558_c1_g1~~TRINITY_DN17558_c1_g1_i1.p1  ORF type:complete len:217 (+),score=43.23 TRINITY_DN17558_c1_g1_i1:41-652(+)
MARSPRLLCLDLDGTLLNAHWFQHHKVSPANRDAVAAASKAGFHVAFCSGRGPTFVLPTPAELGIEGDIFLVGYNGGIVHRLDNSGASVEQLLEKRLDEAQLDAILAAAEGLSVVLDIGDLQYAVCGIGDEQQQWLESYSSSGELRARCKEYCRKDMSELPNKASVLLDAAKWQSWVASTSIEGGCSFGARAAALRSSRNNVD